MTLRADASEPIAALIERVRRGGDDAESSFEQIFSRFYSRVHRSFPPRVGMADRDELTLDVFERVYRGIGRAPTDEGGFERWIHRIAKNIYLNWLRYKSAAMRHAAEVPISDESASGALTPVASDDPVARAISREALDSAARAIRRLPQMQRRCLLLSASGFSNSEIAAKVACSVNTVKSHLRVARAKLRRLVPQATNYPGPDTTEGGKR